MSRKRSQAIAAVLASLVVAGVAQQVPLAAADTFQKLPDQRREFKTPEGVQIQLVSTRQSANRIVSVSPNQLSHMGYFSGITEVRVDVPKGQYGPPDGILQVGYLVGCQADLSSGLDVTLSPSVNGGVDSTLGASGSVTPSISGSGGVNGNLPNASVNGGISGTGAVNGSVSPSVSGGLQSAFRFSVRAGEVRKLIFSQRLVNGEKSTKALIQYDSVEVVVDHCGGDVKARSFATFVGTTDSANVSMSTRGAPVSLFSGV